MRNDCVCSRPPILASKMNPQIMFFQDAFLETLLGDRLLILYADLLMHFAYPFAQLLIGSLFLHICDHGAFKLVDDVSTLRAHLANICYFQYSKIDVHDFTHRKKYDYS